MVIDGQDRDSFQDFKVQNIKVPLGLYSRACKKYGAPEVLPDDDEDDMEVVEEGDGGAVEVEGDDSDDEPAGEEAGPMDETDERGGCVCVEKVSSNVYIV